MQRSLSVARVAAATLGTGIKFLDDSTQTRIGLPSIVGVDVVHNLFAVMVHLHPAARANHLVSFSHGCHPSLQRSGQRYLLTTVALEQKELRQALAQALDSLPEKYRTVLILRDVQHLSITETAQALGLSEANVKTRLSRARLQMRDALAPGFDGAWSRG